MDMVDYPHWLAGAENAMPTWFFTFVLVYLGVVMAALLFSLFAPSSKGISLGKLRISLPTALVSGVGLSYIGIVAAAALTISIKSADFYGASLMGSVFVSLGEQYESWVGFGLEMGYWLACGAAVYLLVLGLVRQFIVGK